MERIDEIIKVAAIFQESKITPRWFVWEGRKYPVQAVNYVWSDYCGREKIIHFSVTADANTYELDYYSEQFIWKLSKIQNYPPEADQPQAEKCKTSAEGGSTS